MIRINTALKKLRKDRQFSQPQLAKAMKCSVTTVQKYEKAGSDPLWSYILGVLEATSNNIDALVGKLGFEAAEIPSVRSEQIPEEVVLGFAGGALRRATVRRVGLKVALIDAADGHAVVHTAPTYETLLLELPRGTQVFEGAVAE